MNLFERTSTFRSSNISHPSAAQVEALVKFFESSPFLAKGIPKCLSHRNKAIKEWAHMSNKLNSIQGTVKSTQKWMKYWSDKKSAIKKKLRARAAAALRNDGGSEMVPELTEAEQRMAILMGITGKVAEDKDIIVQMYEEKTDQDATNNPSIIVPEFIDTETTSCTSTSSHPSKQLYVLYAEPVPAATSDHGNADTSGSQNNSPIPRPIEEQSATRSSLTVTRPHSHVHIGARRQRRLRYTANSSQSQKHSDFLLSNIAEKFLKLEERRLAIEERTVSILERNAERDRVMAEGLRAMGEGMKALAEVINKS